MELEDTRVGENDATEEESRGGGEQAGGGKGVRVVRSEIQLWILKQTSDQTGRE